MCAGRQSKYSFKSHLRCNLEIAVSITVLPSFVIELHDKYVKIQLYFLSSQQNFLRAVSGHLILLKALLYDQHVDKIQHFAKLPKLPGSGFIAEVNRTS